MKNIVIGTDWIRINDDRINLRAVTRFQVTLATNELKVYTVAGEIFKIALESETSKDDLLRKLDQICGVLG